MHRSLYLAAAISCTAISLSASSTSSSSIRDTDTDPINYPQYLAVNFGWDPGNPSSVTQQSVTDMLTALNNTRGSSKRQLAMSFDFWTLYDANVSVMSETMDAILALATNNDLPVSLSIDATQWWQQRPDLWNWWDTTQPSTYNPNNRYNVEWCGWSPETNATSISWRNWGSQFRMPSPAPNFASPQFRDAAAASMAPLAAKLATWYQSLPENKKYLLAFIRCTQELWEGTNYWYYPNGNYPNGTVAWPESQDPQTGLAGSTQLGYAALCTSGIACSGTNITVAQVDAIISSFVEFAANVLLDAGIPRSRVMSHTGSFFDNPPTKTLALNSPAAAITPSAQPGWSLYNPQATNATQNQLLKDILVEIDNTPWGAPEFNPFLGCTNCGSVAAWAAAFNDTFSLMNNRLLVLQNWNSIYPSNLIGQQGVVAALSEVPSCLVDAASGFSVSPLNATAVTLNFVLSSDATLATIDVGVLGGHNYLPSGRMAQPLLSITLPNVPAITSYALDLTAFGGGVVPVYWQITSRGCTNGGSATTQTIVSDIQVI